MKGGSIDPPDTTYVALGRSALVASMKGRSIDPPGITHLIPPPDPAKRFNEGRIN